VLYAGKLRHKDQVYAGEHEPIISEDLFNRVQQQLRRNGRGGNAEYRNRHGALLRGLLFCKACNRAMSHTFTTRGNRRYRYYTCTNATKRGRKACPSGSLPAVEIENAVVNEIRCIGRDPAVIADTLAEATKQVNAEIERLAAERRAVERGLVRLYAEVRRLAGTGVSNDQPGGLDAANEQIGMAERRLTEIDCRVAELRAERLDASDVATALADFDNVWAALSPREQARLTDTIWRDRQLGLTKELTLPNRAVWAATGNNLAFSRELARRVVWIRLDARMETPEQRTGFRHPDLLAHVRRHRAELVHAALPASWAAVRA
jgi:site-specific DNA recombinase